MDLNRIISNLEFDTKKYYNMSQARDKCTWIRVISDKLRRRKDATPSTSWKTCSLCFFFLLNKIVVHSKSQKGPAFYLSIGKNGK